MVLPEPVGPVTNRIPCGNFNALLIVANVSGVNPKPGRLYSILRSAPNRRITIFSPKGVGREDTRISTLTKSFLNWKAPSCGIRFSAMFIPEIILIRVVIN